VLLSDRDIRAEIAANRVGVEPFDEAMIQPSSVDVRLDKFFRVFENHKYSVIDPSTEQAELTREVRRTPRRKIFIGSTRFAHSLNSRIY
jgi:dCTP deaminase